MSSMSVQGQNNNVNHTNQTKKTKQKAENNQQTFGGILKDAGLSIFQAGVNGAANVVGTAVGEKGSELAQVAVDSIFGKK